MSGCKQTFELINVFRPSKALSCFGYDKWIFLRRPRIALESGILSETILSLFELIIGPIILKNSQKQGWFSRMPTDSDSTGELSLFLYGTMMSI